MNLLGPTGSRLVTPIEIQNRPSEGFHPYYDGGYSVVSSENLKDMVETAAHLNIPNQTSVNWALWQLEQSAEYAAQEYPIGSDDFDRCADDYLEDVEFKTVLNVVYCDPAGNNNLMRHQRMNDTHIYSHRIGLFCFAGFTDHDQHDILTPVWLPFNSPDELEAGLPALKQLLLNTISKRRAA